MAVVLCVALMAAGYGLGRLVGNKFMESILLREGRLPLLLSRPVSQFYDIYTLINSRNPFSRLSGYYSLVDSNMVNNQFITERYGREQLLVIKRTLLWVLSYTPDTAGALKFYSSIYASSDDSLKKDIARYMLRLDKRYYERFIKENKVAPSLAPD